jgi:hypothetical protein
LKIRILLDPVEIRPDPRPKILLFGPMALLRQRLRFGSPQACHPLRIARPHATAKPRRATADGRRAAQVESFPRKPCVRDCVSWPGRVGSCGARWRGRKGPLASRRRSHSPSLHLMCALLASSLLLAPCGALLSRRVVNEKGCAPRRREARRRGVLAGARGPGRARAFARLCRRSSRINNARLAPRVAVEELKWAHQVAAKRLSRRREPPRLASSRHLQRVARSRGGERHGTALGHV